MCPRRISKDIEAFTQEWRKTGSLELAKLAAGYTPQQARKGRHDLPGVFLKILEAPRGVLTETLESVMEKRAAEISSVVVSPEPKALMPVAPVSVPDVLLPPAESEVIPPKATNRPSLTAAYRRHLAAYPEKQDQIAASVIADAIDSSKPRDRLSAAQEVADRIDGKATQRINGGMVFVIGPPPESLVEMEAAYEE